MKLPNRIEQHITETASYKIFSNVIPNNWIIREVTERDYGIDCYVEIVNDENQVTGELISIQLKGIKDGIKWTKKDYYTFSSIKISTTNYWNIFPTPVFICLVDIKNNEVFYCPVKSEIRKNYLEYKKEIRMSYKILKKNKLTLGTNSIFLENYFKEKEIVNFEKELVAFISNYHQYKEFVSSNTGRDIFMGIDFDRILYLTHFYNNLQYLHQYLNLKWDIKSLAEYKKISVINFGDDYSLYEQQMDEVVSKLDDKINPLVLEINELFWNEGKEFWISHNIDLFNVVTNAEEDGTLLTE